MNNLDLTKVLELVKNDPEVLKRLESYLDDVLPDSWGIAGSLRNIGYIMTLKDPSEPEIENKVCTGISRAVAEVIQKQIKAGNPDFINFEMANTVDRDMDTIIGKIAHTATVIKMKNGESFVLDYHHTLNIENPMVFKSVENWEIEKEPQTAEDYLKEHPISNPNGEKTNQQPTNPNQNGVNVGPLASTHSGGPASANVFTRINELLTQINASLEQLDANLQV